MQILTVAQIVGLSLATGILRSALYSRQYAQARAVQQLSPRAAYKQVAGAARYAAKHGVARRVV